MKIYPLNRPLVVTIAEVDGKTDLTDLKLKVTKPDGTTLSDITMTHVSGGIYKGSFTPTQIGQYILIIESSSAPDNNSVDTVLVSPFTDDLRLIVSNSCPQAPQGATPKKIEYYNTISSNTDYTYTITNGKDFVIQCFQGGADDSMIFELWDDPNGNGNGMTLVDVLFVNKSCVRCDLNYKITGGNGTKKIRMRIKAGSFFNSVVVYAKVIGFEE